MTILVDDAYAGKAGGEGVNTLAPVEQLHRGVLLQSETGGEECVVNILASKTPNQTHCPLIIQHAEIPWYLVHCQ